MNLEMLPFSFIAGIIAFFNPCGFALLPAYVSYSLSRQGQTPNRNQNQNPSAWAPAGWGLSLGLVVSAGFLTVFGLLGVIVSALGSAVIGRAIPWVSVAIGLALVLVGGVMLFSRFSLALPLGALVERVGRQSMDREGLLSYYLYGVSFSICSAACTFPIFMAVLLQAFTGGFLGGVLNFLAYAWGMSLMMVLLSLLVGYSKAMIRRYFVRLTRFVHKASALVMIAAGTYLIYYIVIYGRWWPF